MFQTLEIVWNSIKMAFQEFRSNKLRTLLSLTGVAIGIFCIISVLSTVGSLESAIKTEIKSLGSNAVYIDKWDFTGGADYPWWKLMKRPEPTFAEANIIRENVPSAKVVCFLTNTSGNVEYNNISVNNISYYSSSPELNEVKKFEIVAGRNFQESDYDKGSSGIVIGYEAAANLFGNPENAIGKTVRLKNNKRGTIIGVIERQGKSLMETWNLDNCILMTRNFSRQIQQEKYSNPQIIVLGKDEIPKAQLMDELKGVMRAVRKLKPTEEDNFSLNDIDEFQNLTSNIFSSINLGGWIIAALSLLVGMFGVANIMFVTVKERTSQIGLKKAIGAKGSTIMMEFLIESAFLCILGGLIGLSLVFILTQIISQALPFSIFISPKVLLIAIVTCVTVGVIAGIIPASQAAKMNPVVAIRSK